MASRCFAQLRDGSVVEEISYHLVTLYRERADQEASLAAPVIDRQSVTTTEFGDAHGSGAGEKINLIKRWDRHAMMIGTR